MEEDIELEEHEGEVPVLITFAYCDLEEIGDGSSTEPFWVTEEEFKKIQDYYAHPYAHYIGVMINHELPRITQMVEKEVSWYAKDIFIEQIVLNDIDYYLEEDDAEVEDGDNEV